MDPPIVYDYKAINEMLKKHESLSALFGFGYEKTPDYKFDCDYVFKTRTCSRQVCQNGHCCEENVKRLTHNLEERLRREEKLASRMFCKLIKFELITQEEMEMRRASRAALSADIVRLTPTQKAAKLAAGVGPDQKKVVITPPKLATAEVTIVGKAPYLQNRFSSENRDKMMATQKEGSAAKKTRKAKAPKDFNKVYRGSMHISTAGWHGIPCTAIRNAMIDACRLTEMDMVRAKMCIFIEEQGRDKENLEPLIKINGKPQMHIERVKVGMGSTDLAARAMFVKWSATFEITWDDDVFHAQDILNLLARAGWQVGIGAGRPFSKMSGGTGKGTFEVKQ